MSPGSKARLERRLRDAERYARELEREVRIGQYDPRVPRWIIGWRDIAEGLRQKLSPSP